ncbi:MAG: SDR family oxidoreductase [Bradyrhizobiaceae bacterium]|nr:SDR family oxidoreductase [Bradyrhizobiaceae bacterium]
MAESASERGAALVTGAGQRIGREIALTLARAGYAIAIHCRHSKEEAGALVQEIEKLGRRSAILVADLADEKAVSGLVPDAAKALGPLNLLVNSAAVFEPDQIGALSRERWQHQFAVNLAAPVFLTEAFAAQAPAGSAVVNIVDQRIFKLTPHFFSYTLTKAALAAATHTLAQALAPKIRVNGVAPGPTLPSPRQDPAEFARQAALLPLGHGPMPADIAQAVLFLASAESTTGVIVAVDGGQHIAWKTPDIEGIRE